MAENKPVKVLISEPFSKVEGLQIITSSGGVQKQSDVYVRNSTLFVSAKGGFVTLYANKSTSVPSVLWQSFIYSDEKIPKMAAGSLNHLKLVEV